MKPPKNLASWKPSKPTTELKNAALLQPGAMDDPECTPGKDSPYEPHKLGSRKPQGPFGLHGMKG